MARIQSSVGLVTGLPIAETVNQLIAISARPKDLLVQRTKMLQSEQAALTELTSLVIGTQIAMKRLAGPSLFQRQQAVSSNPDVLSAEITGTPAAGTYRFTPVQKAQAHQVLSDGFAAADKPLGEGEIAVRFGGFVDRGVSLDDLNGGQGVERGKIRITDRSGDTAVIDLRFALTMDDVLEAINTADSIRVTASAVGDRLRLVDNTNQTASNLRVQEVGTGRTAADLGLEGINTAANSATGDDVLRLSEGLQLQRLNDGSGVNLRQGIPDLEVTFRDGSSALQIDFRAQTKGATAASAVTDAVHGIDAQVQLTSVGTGESYDGYRLTFVDDEDIVAGNETVDFNSVTKRIVVRIDAGSTRAYQVIEAINGDATAQQFFTASAPSGGNATGLIDGADEATSSGGAAAYKEEETLGDVLATINAADPARLQARISADGDRIELVDLTTDRGGTFSVQSLFGGSVAEDLGLTTAESGGVISGRRRLAGLDTVLLDSLAGGRGLGTLGLLSLTDRAGASSSINLAAAETLSDVIEAINGAAVEIEAQVNGARTVCSWLTPAAGAARSRLPTATGRRPPNSSASKSPTRWTPSTAAALDLQTFHERMALDSLNRGQGVSGRSFLITDSAGQAGAVNLAVSEAETVGDVLDLINALNIGVAASINDTGDGILLWDTAGGSGSLKVEDAGNGTAASDLRIAGTAVSVTRNGVPTQVIDGTTTLRIQTDEQDTLQDLVDRINEAEAGMAASVFFTGTGTAPYRLSLTSGTTGRDGEMLVDARSWGKRFHEVAPADDAVVIVGSANSTVAGAIAVSSNNDFERLVEGVTLTVHKASAEEVAVEVAPTDEPVVAQMELFVQQYNKLRDKLDELTFYNETDKTTGVLFGTTEALRLDSDLSRLITGRFFYTGSVQSLENVGFSLDDKGKLSFDKDEFRDKYREDPEAVEQFFTQEERGVAARFDRLAQQLAGVGNSVLLNRLDAVQETIGDNQQRISELTAALDRERERLLNQFYRLETVISGLQTQLNALTNIQAIPPLGSSSN